MSPQGKQPFPSYLTFSFLSLFLSLEVVSGVRAGAKANQLPWSSRRVRFSASPSLSSPHSGQSSDRFVSKGSRRLNRHEQWPLSPPPCAAHATAGQAISPINA